MALLQPLPELNPPRKSKAGRSGKSADAIGGAYKSEPCWCDVSGFFILTFAYDSTLADQLRFIGRNFGVDHLEADVDSAFREIRHVLKPDGILAANVLLHPRACWQRQAIAERIDRWSMRKGVLHAPYEREDVRRRLTEAGLVIVSERVSGNCYDIVASSPKQS